MKTKTEMLNELAAKMQREAEESKTYSPYSLAAKVTIFYADELAAILALPDDTVSVPNDAEITAACRAYGDAYGDYRERMQAALIAAHLGSLK